MSARHRTKGGEINSNSGQKWSEEELLSVYKLYILLNGQKIHETNKEIVKLGKLLNRTTRSVESQLLMFRSLDKKGEYGRHKSNKLIKNIWESQKIKTSNKTISNTKHQMNQLSSLFNWQSHSTGGVKIVFSDKGTPTKCVISTDLIIAIDKWLNDIEINSALPFTNFLFLGGPGNGKTEALEYLIKGLAKKYNFSDQILNSVYKQAQKTERNIEIHNPNNSHFKSIILVQDASKGYSPQTNPSHSVLKDYQHIKNDETLYFCCMNRGILQDVILTANTNQFEEELTFFKTISECFENPSEISKNTWPLELNFPQNKIKIGVWPMENSSLLDNLNKFSISQTQSPFEQTLNIALDNEIWQKTIQYYDTKKINSAFCPLLKNKESLTKSKGANLISILKEYETISSRNFTFREILSLLSILLVGNELDFIAENNKSTEPHEIIEILIRQLDDTYEEKASHYESLFKIAMLQWEFKLFHLWPDITEITKDKSWKSFLKQPENNSKYPAVKAFCNIFSNSFSEPKTDLDKILHSISQILDPGKISNLEITDINFNPKLIDTCIQESVATLITTFDAHSALNEIDLLVLQFFSKTEEQLDKIKISNDSNSINPIIERLNFILRKTASTYIKRKIGTFYGVTHETRNISDYNNYSNEKELKLIISKLLNITNTHKHDNEMIGIILINLNTTFGQPELDQQDIKLEKSISYNLQIISPEHSKCLQPLSNKKFLQLSIKPSSQENKSFAIPLTYKLYNTIKDIGNGLKKGTIPRDIVATFDRMKSFLDGVAVHIPEGNIVFPEKQSINLSDVL